MFYLLRVYCLKPWCARKRKILLLYSAKLEVNVVTKIQTCLHCIGFWKTCFMLEGLDGLSLILLTCSCIRAFWKSPQSNLSTTTTLIGDRRKWPLWSGGRYGVVVLFMVGHFKKNVEFLSSFNFLHSLHWLHDLHLAE